MEVVPGASFQLTVAPEIGLDAAAFTQTISAAVAPGLDPPPSSLQNLPVDASILAQRSLLQTVDDPRVQQAEVAEVGGKPSAYATHVIPGRSETVLGAKSEAGRTDDPQTPWAPEIPGMKDALNHLARTTADLNHSGAGEEADQRLALEQFQVDEAAPSGQAQFRPSVRVRLMSPRRFQKLFLPAPGADAEQTAPSLRFPDGYYPPVDPRQKLHDEGKIRLEDVPVNFQDWDQPFNRFARDRRWSSWLRALLGLKPRLNPVLVVMMEGGGYNIQFAGNPVREEYGQRVPSGVPQKSPEEFAAFVAPRIRELFQQGRAAVELVNFACLADYNTAQKPGRRELKPDGSPYRPGERKGYRPYNEGVQIALLRLLEPELRAGLRVRLYGAVGTVNQKGEVNTISLDFNDVKRQHQGDFWARGNWRVRLLRLKETWTSWVLRGLRRLFAPTRVSAMSPGNSMAAFLTTWGITSVVVAAVPALAAGVLVPLIGMGAQLAIVWLAAAWGLRVAAAERARFLDPYRLKDPPVWKENPVFKGLPASLSGARAVSGVPFITLQEDQLQNPESTLFHYSPALVSPLFRFLLRFGPMGHELAALLRALRRSGQTAPRRFLRVLREEVSDYWSGQFRWLLLGGAVTALTASALGSAGATALGLIVAALFMAADGAHKARALTRLAGQAGAPTATAALPAPPLAKYDTLAQALEAADVPPARRIFLPEAGINPDFEVKLQKAAAEGRISWLDRRFQAVAHDLPIPQGYDENVTLARAERARLGLPFIDTYLDRRYPDRGQVDMVILNAPYPSDNQGSLWRNRLQEYLTRVKPGGVVIIASNEALSANISENESGFAKYSLWKEYRKFMEASGFRLLAQFSDKQTGGRRRFGEREPIGALPADFPLSPWMLTLQRRGYEVNSDLFAIGNFFDAISPEAFVLVFQRPKP